MTENLSEESYRLEGIAFGLADGLIMCLGLIIGVAEVTSDTRFVIITGIIGGLHVCMHERFSQPYITFSK